MGMDILINMAGVSGAGKESEWEHSEDVRLSTGFGGVDSFGYPNEIKHARGVRCGHSFNNRSTLRIEYINRIS